MLRLFLNQTRVFTGVVLLLLVGSLMPTAWARGLSVGPRTFVNTLLTPIQRPLASISTALRPREGLDVRLGSISDMERQVLETRVELAQLRANLAAANARIEQLADVRRQLGLRGVTLLTAVAEWSPSRQFQALTLNRGAGDGVVEGQVVADGLNLIGRITVAAPVMASVRPVTNPGTHLAVRIAPARGGDRFTLVQVQSLPDGRGFLARADVADPVQLGDLAHLQDVGWPPEAQGLIVGQVVAINHDEQDPILRRQIVIAPLREVSSIRHVVVFVPQIQPISPPEGAAAPPPAVRNVR